MPGPGWCEKECLLWLGAGKTYGQVRINGKSTLLHRYVYAQVVGPIPEGYDVDHLCRRKRCWEPTHLEAVTRQINLLRGATITARNASRSHCPAGHPYAGKNLILILTPKGTPSRACRRCRHDRYRLAR